MKIDLQKKINTAFSRVTRPTVLVLPEQEAKGDYGDALWFQGRVRESVTWDNWQDYPDSLCFFTADAFRYYLPSALTLSLTQPNGWLRVADSILTELVQASDDPLWQSTVSRRFQALEHSELEVTCEWVNHISSFQKYWSRDGDAAKALGQIRKLRDDRRRN